MKQENLNTQNLEKTEFDHLLEITKLVDKQKSKRSK